MSKLCSFHSNFASDKFSEQEQEPARTIAEVSQEWPLTHLLVLLLPGSPRAGLLGDSSVTGIKYHDQGNIQKSLFGLMAPEG